jgi:hypothetical protein
LIDVSDVKLLLLQAPNLLLQAPNPEASAACQTRLDASYAAWRARPPAGQRASPARAAVVRPRDQIPAPARHSALFPARSARAAQGSNHCPSVTALERPARARCTCLWRAAARPGRSATAPATVRAHSRRAPEPLRSTPPLWPSRTRERRLSNTPADLWHASPARAQHVLAHNQIPAAPQR